jgi:hypothetical protein
MQQQCHSEMSEAQAIEESLRKNKAFYNPKLKNIPSN